MKKSVVAFAMVLLSGVTLMYSVSYAYAQFIPPSPVIETCDIDGSSKDVFAPGDKVYVKGSGYPVGGGTYDLYVVMDVEWTGGMEIPPGLPGAEPNVSTDEDGNISPSPTVAWKPPLEPPGKYDIVVDVNDNGKYDVGVDAIDDLDVEGTAGFFVIPELPLGVATGLIVMLASLALFQRRTTIRKKL